MCEILWKVKCVKSPPKELRTQLGSSAGAQCSPVLLSGYPTRVPEVAGLQGAESTLGETSLTQGAEGRYVEAWCLGQSGGDPQPVVALGSIKQQESADFLGEVSVQPGGK